MIIQWITTIYVFFHVFVSLFKSKYNNFMGYHYTNNHDKSKVKVTRTNGTSYTRRTTKIEKWAEGCTYDDIARLLAVNHKDYNELMEHPKRLTIEQLVKLIRITDHTITDLLFSTIEDTDLKELSPSEINYVARERDFE